MRLYFNEGMMYTPQTIFRIKFDWPPGFAKGQRRPEEIRDYFYQQAKSMLAGMASVVMKKLYEALRIGGRFRVGATGAASRNFFVRMGMEGSGRPFVEVCEGGVTKANYFIRTGSIGHGNPPPESAIRRWLITKRIPLVAQQIMAKHKEMGAELGKRIINNMRTKRERRYLKSTYARAKEQVRYTKPHSGRPVRPVKGSQNLFEEVLDRIRWSIAARGTSSYSIGRPPVGRPYFDYLWWVAEQEHQYTKILQQSTGELTRVILEFGLSGKKDRGIDRLLQQASRYRIYR